MTKSHGRIETRKIWTSTELVGYLEIPFVAQVFPYRASQNESARRKGRTGSGLWNLQPQQRRKLSQVGQSSCPGYGTVEKVRNVGPEIAVGIHLRWVVQRQIDELTGLELNAVVLSVLSPVCNWGSEGFQVFNQCRFFLLPQAQYKEAVVVLDYITQGRETAVVVEPARLVGPKPLQRRSSVTLIGRPVCLEVIDADF